MPELTEEAVASLDYTLPEAIREYVEMIDGTPEVRGSDSALEVWFDDFDGVQPVLKFEGGHNGWRLHDIEYEFEDGHWVPESIETHEIAIDASAEDIQDAIAFP